MSLNVRYYPLKFREQVKKGLLDFYIRVNYKMYPEMEDEYNPGDFPEHIVA
jgi:hypothetical protein